MIPKVKYNYTWLHLFLARIFVLSLRCITSFVSSGSVHSIRPPYGVTRVLGLSIVLLISYNFLTKNK